MALAIALFLGYNAIGYLQNDLLLPVTKFLSFGDSVAYLILAIALFTQKKNAALLVASGIVLFIKLARLAVYPGLGNAVNMLGILLMFVILLFCCVPNLKDKGAVIKKLWFLPFLVILVSHLMFWGPMLAAMFEYFDTTFKDLVPDIAETITILLVCLWGVSPGALTKKTER